MKKPNNFFVVNTLSLKMFSCKLFAIKILLGICFGFHSHFEKYINKVFCLTFS